jgi:hypothetical protein
MPTKYNAANAQKIHDLMVRKLRPVVELFNGRGVHPNYVAHMLHAAIDDVFEEIHDKSNNCHSEACDRRRAVANECTCIFRDR